MFDVVDRAYYARRSDVARSLAAASSDPSIKRIHSLMAEEYERRSEGEDPQPMNNLGPHRS